MRDVADVRVQLVSYWSVEGQYHGTNVMYMLNGSRYLLDFPGRPQSRRLRLT